MGHNESTISREEFQIVDRDTTTSRGNFPCLLFSNLPLSLSHIVTAIFL